MSIYAIADLHLSFDERIAKPMDIFGDRWANHADRVREEWLARICPEDTVLIAGDISWGLRLDEAMADLEWIHGLPGHKVIIKGNHDLWWTSIGKLNGLYEDITFLQNHCYVVPDTGIAICGTRGWICPGTSGFDEHDRKIYERELLRLQYSLDDAKQTGAEKLIAALHYPPTNDKMQPSGFTEMLSSYGVSECVYGHLHGAEIFRNGLKGTLNGVRYRLISLDYVKCVPQKIWP